jgi:predicted lysophospholipase L1 biosynthesis ABC-type transport system permease subunit
VVNQALVRRYFGGANPIGREIYFQHEPKVTYRIAGVAADAKYDGVRRAVPFTIYLPNTQQTRPRGMNFALRTSGDPLRYLAAVRAAVAEIDPTLPLSEIRTQEEQVKRSMAPERTFALLASFFGFVSVLLAAIGLYGVLNYAVSRRTAEFGIRMALGANGRDIRWLAVRGSLWVVLAGIAIGVPAAWALARLIRNRLYGVEPLDPVSLTLALAAMLLAGSLAAYLPGRRAAKSDPATALRYE